MQLPLLEALVKIDRVLTLEKTIAVFAELAFSSSVASIIPKAFFDLAK